MKSFSTKKQARGFSLLELAVVMMLVGVLGMVFWQFLPRIMQLPAIAKLNAPALRLADDAVKGFVLVQSRLPCPDTTGSGFEDCTVPPSGVVPVMGWLPARSLGLSLSERVRYGVYRAPAVAPASVVTDGDLAALKNRQQPLLPPGLTSTQTNGLDFCVGLRNLVATPGTVLTAGVGGSGPQNIPIAYGLAVAGPTDANGDGAMFDGLNTVAGKFSAAGTPRSSVPGQEYDDETVTTGVGELFTRLGCASRLAEANSAARAAWAAYDTDQFAQRYVAFRTFAITVREMNVTAANVGIVLAAADLAISVGTGWSGVALVAVTAGGAGGGTAAAVAASVAATAALGVATASKVMADNAVTLARSQLAPAQSFKTATAGDVILANARALELDQKGLLP
jgi:prepilin-type N-terminal cleavage/methylation domain-containing protein